MSRDAYIAGRSGSRSYSGSGGSSNASFQAGQQERQRDQSNQQSRQSQPKDNRSGNEKAADQLARLQNQGKGATNQAEDLKYRLASSDAKADQFHADGRPMSYYEKLNAAYAGQIPGFLQDNIQSQVQNYQNNPPKVIIILNYTHEPIPTLKNIYPRNPIIINWTIKTIFTAILHVSLVFYDIKKIMFEVFPIFRVLVNPHDPSTILKYF